MAHPRMYQDHDPYLAELRSVCLSFPEAVEIEAWGRPTFRAGKKMFAVFEVNESHPYAVIFKPEPGERQALIGDSRFYVPAYFGPGGWLALDFTAAPVDWDEIAELMNGSYRQVALKRMLRSLDDRPTLPPQELEDQADDNVAFVMMGPVARPRDDLYARVRNQVRGGPS